MKFTWTDDAVALLRRRAREGAPVLDVAAELGTTRSAVVGKARRLGVSFAVGGETRFRPAARAEVALLDDVIAARPDDGAVLWELRRTQCRWLTRSGPPWVFCGRPVARKSYCEEHAARVYVPFKKEETTDAAQ